MVTVSNEILKYIQIYINAAYLIVLGTTFVKISHACMGQTKMTKVPKMSEYNV